MSSIKLTEVSEGLVSILVPDLALYSKGRRVVEPAWAPVFYNPATRVSRDISVALLAAYAESVRREGIRVCEPLSATGVRGLRYAAEVAEVEEVVINDRSKLAYDLQVENIARNALSDKVRAYNREARALLLECAERGEKFDVVDIDPFGSPAPFVEAALAALKHKGLLMITATDLAPLFGVAPNSCRRKYFAVPLRSEFSKEVGARILAAFVIREAAKMNIAAQPIYSFLSGHSLRLAFITLRSRSRASALINRLGGVVYCPRCAYRAFSAYPPLERACPNCGAEVVVGGPVWTGELWDAAFSLSVLEHYRKRSYLSQAGLRTVELIALEASSPPLYTTVSTLSRVAGLPGEPSLEEVAEAAARTGATFSRTHFDPKGFRCTLQPYEMVKVLVGL